MRKTISIILILAMVSVAVAYLLQPQSKHREQYTSETRSFEQKTGTRYQPIDPSAKPTLTDISQRWFQGANSIWGATGRDDKGNIWFGISGNGTEAAHLVEYNPEIDRFIDHGDPVSALKEAGLYRDGEEQIKIHSKIVQMDDGWLYFASMDETGERADGSQLPLWGSHFWRYNPLADHWEHLFSAPEGLIAVSGVGRWVYALGYWGHVLYQYDTLTGQTRHIRVGSEGGHISRNLVADRNGHVYVPRVKYFDLGTQVDSNVAATDPTTGCCIS